MDPERVARFARLFAGSGARLDDVGGISLGRLLRQQHQQIARRLPREIREGVGVGVSSPLLPGADDGRRLIAVMFPDQRLDRRLRLGPAAGRVEHDIAALDIGGDITPAEFCDLRAQLRHRELASTDIHRPEQSHHPRHVGTLANN